MQVGLQELKDKSLLLLISSSLDIENYLLELSTMLMWMHRLRLLWIPTLDDHITKNMKKQYRSLADQENLLSVRNLHGSIAPGFKKFVIEKFFPEFQIGGDPIIVSLDEHGRIVHCNAMNMILMRIAKGLGWPEVGTGDGIIPLLQNVLKERTLAVRDLVPDIDGKINEIAAKMNAIMIDWLRDIDQQKLNSVCLLF